MGNMAAVATDLPSQALADAVTDAYQTFCGSYQQLLVAIAAHDRGDAYRVLGVRTEDDWLRRVVDVEWRTARDWVRQARLIGTHPEIGDRFGSGELSVDK